jgi:hydroxymethylpyrimidine/phosphomethylpyrimidine kinase
VRAQLVPVIEEFQIAAVKIGMLPTREVVLEVARLLSERNLPAPVVDPVLRSSSGHQLMNEDAIAPMLSELFPQARVITPNIPEAERLTGLRIEDENGMRAAALKLREMGAPAVLIKGGHLRQPGTTKGSMPSESMPGVRLAQRQSSERAVDVLDNHGHVAVFGGEWIDAPQVRGTGCMLSSAIAAGLGKGMKLEAAVSTAKDFVAKAIRKVTDQASLETWPVN